jgi:hypothetical protein
MTVMLLLLSMGLQSKTTNIKILSDFKIWNQNHAKDWLIFPET